jgi:hypothetical protein
VTRVELDADATTCWVIAIPGERYAVERLFLRNTLDLGDVPAPRPRVGDPVVLVALAGAPLIFALGRVAGASNTVNHGQASPSAGSAALEIAYTNRLFDKPIPADGLLSIQRPGIYLLDGERFTTTIAMLEVTAESPGQLNEWQVELCLPIEAASPADAVRSFWTYINELGPSELPVFVAPIGDELALTPYVHSDPAIFDPDEL